MTTRMSGIKRRKIRDQEEIIKMKDDIIASIEECQSFS